MEEERNNIPLDRIMFMVGSQSDAEGDMLPQAFSICSTHTDPEVLVARIMDKITDDLGSLGIDHSEGSLTIQAIETWQEFADLKIPGHVKIQALASAIIDEFLHAFCRSGSAHAEMLAAAPWATVPTED